MGEEGTRWSVVLISASLQELLDATQQTLQQQIQTLVKE